MYCICRQPDDGDRMVSCDSCKEWFHERCVNFDPEEYSGHNGEDADSDEDEDRVREEGKPWFCPGCLRAHEELAKGELGERAERGGGDNKTSAAAKRKSRWSSGNSKRKSGGGGGASKAKVSRGMQSGNSNSKKRPCDRAETTSASSPPKYKDLQTSGRDETSPAKRAKKS